MLVVAVSPLLGVVVDASIAITITITVDNAITIVAIVIAIIIPIVIAITIAAIITIHHLPRPIDYCMFIAFLLAVQCFFFAIIVFVIVIVVSYLLHCYGPDLCFSSEELLLSNAEDSFCISCTPVPCFYV